MFTKSLLFSLLLTVGSSFAGPLDPPPDKPYPTGFAEIAWGTPSDRAKTAMLAKPSVVATPPGADGNMMAFAGGTFAGAPVEFWELYFTKNRLSKGIVFIKPADPKQAYAELKKQITKKYRKEGRQEFGGGMHYATYWDYATKEGSWMIACDVNTGGIRLTYKQSPAAAPITKDAKKEL